MSDVRVFGSVARGEQGPDSDLDLLVHLPEDTGLVLGRFGDELHKLLGVPVHVVPDDGLKPRVRASREQPDLAPARSRRTATGSSTSRRASPPSTATSSSTGSCRRPTSRGRLAVLGSIRTGIAYPGGRQAASAADAVLAQRGQLWIWRTRHGPTARAASLLQELAHQKPQHSPRIPALFRLTGAREPSRSHRVPDQRGRPQGPDDGRGCFGPA
ncbi:MAG: nucleotidyltransferase family protein [Mycobacteriales bacterium]